MTKKGVVNDSSSASIDLSLLYVILFEHNKFKRNLSELLTIHFMN